jgi:hypothetical protein
VNAVASVEGVAAWDAGMAALRAGMAGPELDLAGAMAIGTARGADPRTLAPLLAAFAAGVRAAGSKADEP